MLSIRLQPQPVFHSLLSFFGNEGERLEEEWMQAGLKLRLFHFFESRPGSKSNEAWQSLVTLRFS